MRPSLRSGIFSPRSTFLIRRRRHGGRRSRKSSRTYRKHANGTEARDGFAQRARETRVTVRSPPPGGAKPGEQRVDRELPAPLDRLRARAEPARVLGERETLHERDDRVCEVGLVAAQHARLDAAPDALDDQRAHGAARLELVLVWVEVAERVREHHLREHRVLADERAVERERRDEVRARVAGFVARVGAARAARGSRRSTARARAHACRRTARRQPASTSAPRARRCAS